MAFAMGKVLVQHYGLGIRFEDSTNVGTPSFQKTADIVYYYTIIS
jgi:hypothetical protein